MIYRVPQNIQDILSSLPSEADRARLGEELQALYRAEDLFNTIIIAAVDALGIRYDDVLPSPTITAEVAAQIMKQQIEQRLQDKYDEGRDEEKQIQDEIDDIPAEW